MSSPLRRPEPAAQAGSDRRWLALGFIAVAQLMIALDATIVSIALPTAQRSLGASDAERQWVITAYTLAFGGLLLAGGRIADAIGRKRAFLGGLAGFALASAVGGAAPSFSVLLAARATQGAFAAVLAPTALSLLAVTFTEPRQRARAFAVYGGIAGSGAALGLLLGGVLTQFLDWRWCLFVNIPFAVVAALGGWQVLAPAGGRGRQRLDLPGVLLVTGGLAGLVYGCTQVSSAGWTSPAVLGFIGAGVILLFGFVLRERNTDAPLLPLQIVLDRNRGGASLTAAFAIAAMFGAFLFLTYYLQVVLRYTPVEAGIGFLPLTIASQAGSWGIASVLMPRVRARFIMAPGALVAAAGMLLLSRIGLHSSYLTLVLPAEILIGIGIACVMAPAFNVGTFGVDPRQAGVAAAVVNASVQIGASIGTAVLNTVATSTTAAELSMRPSAQFISQALVDGYARATVLGAAIVLAGGILAFLLISAGKPARH